MYYLLLFSLHLIPPSHKSIFIIASSKLPKPMDEKITYRNSHLSSLRMNPLIGDNPQFCRRRVLLEWFLEEHEFDVTKDIGNLITDFCF